MDLRQFACYHVVYVFGAVVIVIKFMFCSIIYNCGSSLVQFSGPSSITG